MILIIQIVALIFLALATFSVPSHPRFQWLPAGLFLWLLSLMIYANSLPPLHPAR